MRERTGCRPLAQPHCLAKRAPISGGAALGGSNVTKSYGADPGWQEDGSLLIRRRSSGRIADEHERVTRIKLKEDGTVEASRWLEGPYGFGERRGHTWRVGAESAQRIKTILSDLKGQEPDNRTEERLLEIL